MLRLKRAFLEAGLVAVASLLLAGASLAAKPVHGTVTLDQADPHYGDVVDFHVTTDLDGTGVRLECSQDGAIVAVSSTIWHYGTFDYTSERVGLASPIWQGGAATCTAFLLKVDKVTWNGFKSIASTTFEVAP